MRTMTVGGITILLFGTLAFAADVKSNPSDQAFIRMAADIDMTEAHLGQLAEQQAPDQSVKDFAKTLASDHSTAYGQLLEVGQKTHMDVPRGIDIHKDAAFRQLEHAKGTSFERAFLQNEIRDHQKALAEFKREAEHGENPDVKNYAKQQLSVLEQHLRTAEDLAKKQKT